MPARMVGAQQLVQAIRGYEAGLAQALLLHGFQYKVSGWISYLAQSHDVTARSPLRYVEWRSICSGMGRMVNESFRSCSR